MDGGNDDVTFVGLQWHVIISNFRGYEENLKFEFTSVKPSVSPIYFHDCIHSKSKLRLTGLFLVSLNANGISYIGCREGGSFRQTSRPDIVSKVRFILGLRDKKCNSIINMDDTVGNKYAHRAKRNIVG